MVRYRHNLSVWLLCGVMLLLVSPLWAAEINVQSDRNPVAMNESFRLTFEADGAVDDDPDFKLLEQDFEILQQSQGTTMQIINGQVSQARQWTVTLMPRRSGRLIIPAISFGKDKSEPLAIMVSQAAEPSATASHSVLFIEVSAEPEAAYVQSQIVYKARLFRAVNVANARLSEPVISGVDAVVEQLGEDREFETMRDGRRYIVLERSYAIFPQQSGEVTIAPLTFEGQVVNRARGMFDVFDQSGPIRRVRSEALTLDVKAPPAGQDQPQWLPAREVKLIEAWPDGVDLSQPVTAGEPLTWTLTLMADGLTAAQLPTLAPVMPDGMKAYPDQAKQMNDKKQTTLVGVRQEKIALIPTQAGEYQLPAIEVPWWNSRSGQREVARLPARTLRVVMATGSSSTIPEATVATKPPLATSVQPTVNSASVAEDGYFWRVVSAVLGLGWLLTSFAWLMSRRARVAEKTSQPEKPMADIGAVKNQIKAACLNQHPDDARAALLTWGRLFWSEHPPAGLGQLAQRVRDESLRREILALNQQCYGPVDSNAARAWDGERMWQAFERELTLKQSQSAASDQTLAPMYL